MDSMDSTAFEQMVLKLGLVTHDQIAEVHEEIGETPDLPRFIAALERKGYMTPWQRSKVLKGDTDGFILGGYKLLYKIQSGSFGRVYRAVDPRDGRVVAVKVLRRRWSENEQRIEMFIREGKVGLMLKHSNIVEVLAINRDPASAQYYIVMEFVEGGNLREILHIRKKLTVPESLRYIEDCANGLTYAYSRGMTHRDIKLTNILISDSFEAKLVDFGLAQFFSTFARTEEEKVDRTVDYAGLERATEVKMGDVRSDIYFLGCVLYECLTGRPPLAMTRDKHARMRKGRFEEVRPIHPNETDAPPSVLMLVETMMALDPKARYQTPSQLLDAIRRVRRDIEGKSGNGDDKPPTRSVFLAEPDERLQDVLRDGLKNQGYRVFLAGDPLRALDRFHKQPYDGLIVDARTTGEEGIRVFESVIDEAARRRLRCAGLLLLDEEQADRAERMPSGPHIAVLIENETDPITYRNMSRTLRELMESAHESKALPTLVRPAPLPPPPLPPPPPAPRVIEEPPPIPVSRVVEVPPKRARRDAETPPPKSAPRAAESPPPPREEVVPPKPRREPIVPAAFSPSPPIEVSAPPTFLNFSVMTDDSLALSEDEDTAPPPPRIEPEAPDDFSSPRPATATPPPKSEPMIPDVQALAPPREEIETPPSPHREQMDEAASPPPREEVAPPPPPRHEPATVSARPTFSRPVEDVFPMLALEEGMVLPPPEESIPEAQRKAAVSQRRRQKAASMAPDLENIIAPLRKAEPRKKREPQPVMQHVTHEDPLAAPDTHHWRDELGMPEKQEEEKSGSRLREFWESLTPKQKSISGLSLLALVVVLFLVYMVSDMLIYRHFDKIQEGMSIQEVEAIMGGPGEKIDLNPGGKGRKESNIRPETMRWEKGNKIIMVTFSNGTVLEGGKQIVEK
jgi:eukaryotic-like serine/threonine-protein kinase